MLRLALCDDNPKFLVLLKELTTTISSGISQELALDVRCFLDGKELIDNFNNGNRYDLIVLDWDMPELDGEHTGMKIRELDQDCLIIFITSFAEHAIRASRLTTFRYITKDRLIDDLPEALRAAYDKQLFNDVTIQIKEINGSHHIIRVKDIVAVENQSRKTQVYLKTNEIIIAPRSFLSDYAEFFLKNTFVMSYKGVLINPREISKLNQLEVIMSNGHKAPMSRKYRQDVFIQLQRVMEYGV